MSEVQTSPAPVEAAPVADSGVVESPTPSGNMTEQPMEELSSAPTQSTPEERPQSWDHTSWDGNPDTLPGHLQEPVRFLHKQLEGGYTKKFQSLADERKEFDTLRSEWDEKNSSWEDQKAVMESELKILRTLMDGGEDPRLSQSREKNETLSQQLAEMKQEYARFQDYVRKDVDQQAQSYAENFRLQHQDIFKSEAKRAELGGLLDQKWSPEEAVKLIGADKRVLGLASELREKGVPPEVAVEHAMMKMGAIGSRKPRPGAQLTSGARSQNNPASARRSVTSAGNSREARLMAAREAVNWRSKTKL